jgi:hypothetical protein
MRAHEPAARARARMCCTPPKAFAAACIADPCIFGAYRARSRGGVHRLDRRSCVVRDVFCSRNFRFALGAALRALAGAAAEFGVVPSSLLFAADRPGTGPAVWHLISKTDVKRLEAREDDC